MRTIRVFVLRLLVDPAEPKVLRGALQAMPEGETMPFADAQALLALLWQMTLPTMGALNGGTAGNRNVKGEEGIGK
jgi:hypothetical protein